LQPFAQCYQLKACFLATAANDLSVLLPALKISNEMWEKYQSSNGLLSVPEFFDSPSILPPIEYNQVVADAFLKMDLSSEQKKREQPKTTAARRKRSRRKNKENSTSQPAPERQSTTISTSIPAKPQTTTCGHSHSNPCYRALLFLQQSYLNI
jgi:hypothetical protein